MSRRFFGLMLLTGSIGLLRPSNVYACSCSAISTFESEARYASVLVSARVVGTQLVENPDAEAPDNVAAVDVQVLRVLRGKETRHQLRVWDQFAGSSCSVELHRLPVGTLVVIALRADEPPLTEMWPIIGIRPGRADYLLGTCGERIRTFADDTELHKYVDSAEWRRAK